MKRQRDIVIVVLVIGLVGLLTAAFWDYTQDDVFITYTYSRNLAQGNGFVFNPGERVQGTTTPLYTFLMAGVYLVTRDMLHAGNVISAILLLITCGLAVTLLRPYTTWIARVILAVSLAVSPLVYVSYGMETLLYSALLMGALVLWSQKRRTAALLVAAALTWTRADAVVLAGVLCLAALVEVRTLAALWRGPVRLGLVYVAGIAPWFLFAWGYFGSPLPQTFSAKEEFLQGTLFLTDGRNWWEAFYGNNPLTLLAVPLIGIGIWQGLKRDELRPLALWPLLYIGGYTALNVTAFWYYTPLLVVLVALAVIGGDGLAAAVMRRYPAQKRLVVGGVLILVTIASGLGIARAWDYRELPPRMATYKIVGEWIEQHTDPDSTLLVKDLGVVGYYAERYTLDSFGLMVPEMLYTDDTYATAKFKPDYTVTTQYWEMQRLTQEDWFKTHYHPVAQFSTAGDTEFSPMAVYERRLALDTPAEVVRGMDLPLTVEIQLKEGDTLPLEIKARLISENHTVEEAAHPFLWSQYPEAQATDDETFIEQIALPLDVVPGEYRWEVTCGEITAEGHVTVLPLTESDTYRTMPPVEWGEFARLVGVDTPLGTQTYAGGTVTLLLDWDMIGAAESDYSLLVHLVDANGQVVAQADGFPRGRAVNTWAAGEELVDLREIQIPATLPPGEYTLRVGWYDWRMDGYPRVLTADGADAVTLPVTIQNVWPGGSGKP